MSIITVHPGASPSEEGPPPEVTRRSIGKTTVALLLEAWSSLILRQELSPGFGAVTDLSDEYVEAALPPEPPPQAADELDAEDPTGEEWPARSGQPRLQATRWAYAIRRAAESKVPRGTVTTTVGFVEMGSGLRLSLIHYLRPAAMLTAPAFGRLRRRLPPVRIGPYEFPLVLRPWLPETHGSGNHDGHCWVTTPLGLGVLTARHSIRPKDAALGTVVSIASKRRPLKGALAAHSVVLDAAVIIAEQPADTSRPYPHSSTVGFKKVRYVVGHSEYGGEISATVTGMPGIHNGHYYQGNEDTEPPAPALMTTDKGLNRADSGCLAIDVESEMYGHVHPYLMYLGINNLGRGTEGMALLLAQALHQWNLETCALEAAPLADAR